jgi:site-specific recombinase XerD
MDELTKVKQYTLQHDEIERLQAIAQAADRHVADNVFSIYKQTKAPNTIRRQRADLMLFAKFISEIGGVALDQYAFSEHPTAWAIVTGGLVTAYRQWMLNSGYDGNSVNVRLSTLRTYAKLAQQAGTLTEGEYLRIANVSGYSQKEIGRIDAKRERSRIGNKKADPNFVKQGIVAQLKGLDCERPSDYRDRVLLCLMLDHGLRVSEVAALTVANVDLSARTLTINRLKTSTTDLHDLTNDTYSALVDYMPLIAANSQIVVCPLGRSMPVCKRSASALALTTYPPMTCVIQPPMRLLETTICRLLPNGVAGHRWRCRCAMRKSAK